MKSFFLFLATIILTGCATQVWYAPDKSASEAHKDFGQCRMEGVRAADPNGLSAIGSLAGAGGFLGATMLRDGAIGQYTESCMLSKGYRLTKANSITNGQDYPKK